VGYGIEGGNEENGRSVKNSNRCPDEKKMCPLVQ
jgi:hypothetical protein